MKIEKSTLIVGLICCFLGAGIIAFILNRQPSPTIKQGPQGNIANRNQKQPTLQNEEASDIPKNDEKIKYDDISDLEALLGDVIDGDVGDALDMVWSSWEITCDFSDRNKVAEQVNQFPIVSDITMPEEQLAQLRNSAIEMIFNNGNDDYKSYLDFIRKSGESVGLSTCELARKSLIGGGIPEKEVPTDPWELLSEDLKDRKKVIGCRSMWKGLVSEGSRIKLFESRTSQLPLGEDLYNLRGGMTTFRDLTDPPISLDEILKAKGKVIMADVQFFIAHEDVTGGVVWPYIIRYWFDPINNSWRVQRAALFQNRHTSYRIYILP